MNKYTAELLEKHFDSAFAAPGGIKKLRELILTLAIQGKLVPQDPHDQPTSELLKEIEAEKHRLVKESKIKKLKPLLPVTEEEKPYALPQGWEWVRLGNIGLINPRNYIEGDRKAGFVPMPLIQEGYSEFHSFEERPWSEIKKGYTHFKDGDVGMAKITPCFENAKSCVFSSLPNGIGAGTTELHIFRNAFNAIETRYLLFFLKNPKFISEIATKMTGSAGQKRVSTPLFTKLALPLPPKSEQRRILAKFDELMACCDELEKLRTAQQDKRLTIHAAAIKQLLNIAEPDQHQRAQTFLAEHFSELYTVKENVAELRKAILQLGVMGKLIPQDPKDTPVSELLKKIEAEKQRLMKKGKIKQPKPLPSVTEEEKPYALPQGWEWERLGNLALSSDSGWSPQCLPESRKDQGWGVLKVSAVSWGKFNSDENKALPASQKPRLECEVKSGDFLISRANTDELVARSVVVEETPPHLMMSDKIVRFTLSRSVNKAFINMVNGLPYSRAYYIANASGTSSSMKNISRETMSLLPVPIPPSLEQHRIVAKINELMALCDSLEQKIDAAANKQAELLNALIYAQSQANTEKKLQPTSLSNAQVNNLAIYRATIGCYMVSKLANAQYFGRTAAAKVMYLAQAHVGLELNLKPEREAAGPLDKWIYEFERQGQDKGWFEVNEKVLKSGYTKTEYCCLPALSEPTAKAEALMSSGQKVEFDHLIYVLADKKTEEVEIIATLFAVWNDFLIDGIQPTNEQIISDVRENWHESKARFSPTELGRWLDWLRSAKIIPRGLPPRTVQQPKLKLD